MHFIRLSKLIDGQVVIYLKERVVKGDAVLVKASRGKQLEKVIAGMASGSGKD